MAGASTRTGCALIFPTLPAWPTAEVWDAEEGMLDAVLAVTAP